MKARLRTILFSAMSTMVAFFAITYTSCTTDKCKQLVCAYGGVCNDGSCVCQTGYTGTQCGTVSRDLFRGVYVVYEKGSNGSAAQYTVSVSPGATITDVVITNFNNTLTTPVNATVVGDSLFIPTQNVNGKIITGNGFITTQNSGINATLTVRYEVVDSATNATNDYGYLPIDQSAPSIWNKQP